MMRFLLFIPLVLCGSSARAEALLPDGVYGCTISDMFLGAIRVEGNRYWGPAYDEVWGDPHDFEVTGEGTVNWHGPLGGISEAGTVVSTVLGKSIGGRVGFDITIQNARGNFQTITCAP